MRLRVAITAGIPRVCGGDPGLPEVRETSDGYSPRVRG